MDLWGGVWTKTIQSHCRELGPIELLLMCSTECKSVVQWLFEYEWQVVRMYWHDDTNGGRWPSSFSVWEHMCLSAHKTWADSSSSTSAAKSCCYGGLFAI